MMKVLCDTFKPNKLRLLNLNSDHKPAQEGNTFLQLLRAETQSISERINKNIGLCRSKRQIVARR